MTLDVLSIDVHEPVTELIRLFASYPVHHLPVVEQQLLTGIVSSADMLKLQGFLPKSGMLASSGLLNERFKIQSLMRQPVITVGPDEKIAVAASRMVEHGIHALPVINERNFLIGIVTTTDIMQKVLTEIERHDQPMCSDHQSGALLDSAIKVAEQNVRDGSDAQAVCTALLQVHRRNELLEELRRDVARYLHIGAEDAQLHSKLMRNLSTLDRSNRAVPTPL